MNSDPNNQWTLTLAPGPNVETINLTFEPAIDYLETAAIQLLDALGGEFNIDPQNENLKDTPGRVAKTYREILEGNQPDAEKKLEQILSKTFPSKYDEMVVINNIITYGLCPHHLLPVFYTVSFGYIPAARVLGLSKIPRFIDLLAKRLVLQETFTHDIVDYFIRFVEPNGCGVVVRGEHSCMRIRGIKMNQSVAVTSAVRGNFRESVETRDEFLKIGGNR